MPHRLPLTLVIKDLRRSPTAVEVDALVIDADKVSVRYMPLHLSADATPAEIAAVCQSTVTDTAVKLHGRGEAVLADPDGKAATDADFAKLVGNKFTGSVSR